MPLLKTLENFTEDIKIPGPIHQEKLKKTKEMIESLDVDFYNECVKLIEESDKENPTEFKKVEDVSIYIIVYNV